VLEYVYCYVLIAVGFVRISWQMLADFGFCGDSLHQSSAIVFPASGQEILPRPHLGACSLPDMARNRRKTQRRDYSPFMGPSLMKLSRDKGFVASSRLALLSFLPRPAFFVLAFMIPPWARSVLLRQMNAQVTRSVPNMPPPAQLRPPMGTVVGTVRTKVGQSRRAAGVMLEGENLNLRCREIPPVFDI
jgi:hypothetical protein